MKNQYPYQDLLTDLLLFIECGEISLKGKIWIVRTEQAIFGNYHPIVGFYPLDILQNGSKTI